MGAPRLVNAVLCSRARQFSQQGSRDSSSKPAICASSTRPGCIAWHAKSRRNPETKIRVLDMGGGAAGGSAESILDDRPSAFFEDDGDHQESFVTEALELLGYALSQPSHHRLDGDGNGMAASELIASAEEAIRAAGSLDSAPGSLGSPTTCADDEELPPQPLESCQTEPEALLEEQEEERRDELAVIRQILEAREMEESERLELAGLLQRLEETALERRRQRRAPGASSSSSRSSSSSPAWQRKSGISKERVQAAAGAVTGSSDASSRPVRAAEAWEAVLQGSSPGEPPAKPLLKQEQPKPEPAWVRRLETEEGKGRAPLAAPSASPWATSSRAARHRAASPVVADGEQPNGPQS